MADKARKYGTFEYGEVYDFDRETQGRGLRIGKLIVDQDNERFYVKPDGANARNIAHERVNWMLANDLIDFYQEDSRTLLIDYMMRIEETNEAIKENQRKKLAQNNAAKELQENTKLVKKTKRRARFAKAFWAFGCVAVLSLGIIVALPDPEPAPAERSIAGVGMQYPVDAEILDGATYMTAIGNGAELYGMILDNDIVESGQQNANESTIKENVLVNAGVSQKYPVHMRPLYYDRSSFYQTQLVLNDSNGGSSGILLQNPNGYSLGKPANELVLFGGRGMSSIVISSPETFQAQTASETARAIEEAQEQAAEAAIGRGDNTKAQKEYLAAQMPDAWNGYDYADIDSDVIAASYWYTKDSTLKREDLKRRVVIWNIKDVYNKGAQGVNDLEPIQMNYQDRDSEFYNPVVSLSPSSNGSRYWIGYTKKSITGNEGFFIREYENPEDILLEDLDNTYSTRDLTGNEYPITNYTLYGDRLFYEQQGYIWVIDLSKASIVMGDEKKERTIKKENAVRICKSSEIRPTVSRDEQRIANVENATTVPVSHYQVVTMTTAGGNVVHGIAFIEADSGNLVFQPVNGASVAKAEESKGAGGDTSSLDVSSSDQAALEKALREAEEENANRNGNTNKNSNSNSNKNANANSNKSQDSGNPIISGGDTLIETGEADSDSKATDQSIVPFDQSAYTFQQMDDEESIDNGRILVKAGSTEASIVCFCVRGEQFYWIEEDSATKARRLMCSPIYYKNDASKLDSDIMEDINENGEVIKDEPEDEQPVNLEGVTSTTGDIILENMQQAGDNGSQDQITQDGFDQTQTMQDAIVQDQGFQP